jgi:hypothetical protein
MSMLEKVLHRGKSRSSPDLVAKAVATLQRLDEGNATDKQVKPARGAPPPHMCRLAMAAVQRQRRPSHPSCAVL